MCFTYTVVEKAKRYVQVATLRARTAGSEITMEAFFAPGDQVGEPVGQRCHCEARVEGNEISLTG